MDNKWLLNIYLLIAMIIVLNTKQEIAREMKNEDPIEDLPSLIGHNQFHVVDHLLQARNTSFFKIIKSRQNQWVFLYKALLEITAMLFG